MSTTPNLLSVRDLRKHFPVRGSDRVVKAVDGVSFDLAPGRTIAIVGESGCGKTTCAKLLLGLERPTEGSIRFEGREVSELRGADWRHWRRNVQAVFQDPYASLNPRLRVATIVAEPLLANENLTKRQLRERVARLLDIVGLPASAADRFPHEFSGGQRQRIAVARALALDPKLLVLDEPTSALDVSIRAQILNLLHDIQAERGIAYILIAHDLALVEHFADDVAVMYLGHLVECGPLPEVYGSPRHPYTRALLGSVLQPDPDVPLPVGVITGEIGSALDPPSGCAFHPRCPECMALCRRKMPQRLAVGPGHLAACHVAQRAMVETALPMPASSIAMAAAG